MLLLWRHRTLLQVFDSCNNIKTLYSGMLIVLWVKLKVWKCTVVLSHTCIFHSMSADKKFFLACVCHLLCRQKLGLAFLIQTNFATFFCSVLPNHKSHSYYSMKCQDPLWTGILSHSMVYRPTRRFFVFNKCYWDDGGNGDIHLLWC